MGKVADRRQRQAEFINKSSVTFTAMDLAKIFRVSPPTACEDARWLLQNKMVPQNKIRTKNFLRNVFGIK